MDISVVLCTWNNASRLRITLEAFCQLELPSSAGWELVLVNNNSTDDTEAVAQSFDGRLPLTYVYEPVQGLSRARNAGLNYARGELIVFTDDDVKPCRSWLEAYWEAYNERPQGYFFGGPVESEFELSSPDEDFLRTAMPSVAGLEHGAKPRELSRQEILVGANWACPLRYLEEAGQFDEDLGLNATSEKLSVGEENDLMSRLEHNGIKKWYVPSAKIVHFVPKEKCTLDHVVDRTVAIAEKSYRPGYEMPFTLLGMPIGLYKGVVSAYVRWKVRRATGNPWKKEYVNYRMLQELIKRYYKIYT